MIGLLLFFITCTSPALASGPGTGGSKIRVDNKQVGPYILLVATSPLPVTVGQMSIWVRVTGLEDNALRREATVMVAARPRGSSQVIIGHGSHKNAGNDFDYVAHLQLQQAGQWDVIVSVEDELGQAEVAFTETVSRGGFSTGVLISVAIPFIILAIVVGVYLWQRSARAEPG